jgi:hypothetical protein
MNLSHRDMVKERKKVRSAVDHAGFSDQRLRTSLHSTSISVKSSQHHFNFQLKQQHIEVFLYGFNDPIANYLESMSNICVKLFLSDESWLYHLFKALFCWLCIPLFFGSRSRTGSVNQFLTWLHWKHEFT